MMKPIQVWLFPEGPNPLKVLYVLEELQLPYDIKAIAMEDVKKKTLTDLNPNGRVPGAIILYLVEEYDRNNTLTYNMGNERHFLKQWLFFQVSGQGPYFGQATWFMTLHPEKLPSAIERYQREIKRVLGVMEGHLEGRQWLLQSYFLAGQIVLYSKIIQMLGPGTAA
ncbi:putative glutathione s- protein [Eutypa lata UCREL1]|uniref:glutathione transferase n=1 Tax=Eutypa lata (strain UCR-EL1) TaxID=1287681 RepID=M7TRC1_EUTLA|nr:putative glutathione s- protein [Eutypa lata UCREL1]